MLDFEINGIAMYVHAVRFNEKWCESNSKNWHLMNSYTAIFYRSDVNGMVMKTNDSVEKKARNSNVQNGVILNADVICSKMLGIYPWNS